MDAAAESVVDWAEFSRMRAELGASFVRILGYFHEDGEKAVAAIEAAMHAREAAALILPAHTLKSEARQFGATALGGLAEEIEDAGRHAVEIRLFPDHILPQVAQLRALYRTTLDQLLAETNPLAQRGNVGHKAPSNQGFGRL
ncbi:MAG: Hpt domain-containing protein [Sphingosinicella sp.]|uniref:Hpt domain-containing protein n=1 Tax=Sphingosinicella sp. TaxID=1917971 RepID=UPI004037730F